MGLIYLARAGSQAAYAADLLAPHHRACLHRLVCAFSSPSWRPPTPLPPLTPVPQWQPLHDDEDVCPEVRAGPLSRLTFSWMGPLMKRGYRAPLTFADVWRLPPADRSATLDQRFAHFWAAERQRNPENPSLVRVAGVDCWAAGSLESCGDAGTVHGGWTRRSGDGQRCTALWTLRMPCGSSKLCDIQLFVHAHQTSLPLSKTPPPQTDTRVLAGGVPPLPARHPSEDDLRCSPVRGPSLHQPAAERRVQWCPRPHRLPTVPGAAGGAAHGNPGRQPAIPAHNACRWGRCWTVW